MIVDTVDRQNLCCGVEYSMLAQIMLNHNQEERNYAANKKHPTQSET